MSRHNIDSRPAKAGVSLGDHVKGKLLASIVIASAMDKYEVAFGIGELEPTLSGRNIIIAYSMDGKPLIPSSGPFRLVIEGDKRLARDVRMLKELKVVSPLRSN